MALTLTPSPFQQVLVDGEPQSGAKITTSTAGTETPATTYTTAAGDVANTNPIVADSQGRYVAYLSAGASYKFVITTSADVAIDTQDNIASVPGASVNLDVLGTVGEAVTAGQVVYISDGSGSKEAGNWFLADADNTYSSSTAAEIGIVPAAIAINAEGTIRLAGRISTAGSVVVGTLYYVSATAGAITSSAPTNVRTVGIADTTSSLILNANTAVTGIPVPITQDLLFTDNTYDIGKSGATRPRDFFLSRNATIGGTLGATGNTTITGTLTVSNTSAGSLDIGGGLNAGTGNVAILGTDGKIEGPLSSTIIDDLSGANLTTLNAGNLSSGTVATARLGSGTASSSVFLRGDSAWAAVGGSHTTQVFASGSGTYSLPAGCVAIRVRLCGGGGGSGAADSNDGAAGGNSTFAASSMQANGGGGGSNGGSSGGVGGAGGTGANGLLNATGGDGGGGGDDPSAPGGMGGSSYFGSAGGGGTHGGGSGTAGGPYGGGGGGAGSTAGASNSSGGGGGGGYCERLISSPSSTYAYAVGAGGAGGAAGTTAGVAGNAGVVIVEEWYV